MKKLLVSLFTLSFLLSVSSCDMGACTSGSKCKQKEMSPDEGQQDERTQRKW